MRTSHRYLALAALAASGFRLLACTGDDPVPTVLGPDGGNGSDGSTSALSVTLEPAEVTLPPAGRTTVRVKALRTAGVDGTIDLQVDDDDLVATKLALAPGVDRGDLEVVASPAAKVGPRRSVRVKATFQGATTEVGLGVTIAAAPGAFDLSFGDGGIFELPSKGTGGNAVFQAVAPADGGFVVAGGASSVADVSKLEPRVARFDLANQLDPSFGVKGVAEPPGANGNFFAVAEDSGSLGVLSAGLVTARPAFLRVRRNLPIPAYTFLEPEGTNGSARSVLLAGSERYVGGIAANTARVWKLLDGDQIDVESWSSDGIKIGSDRLEGGVVSMKLGADGKVIAVVDTTIASSGRPAIYVVRLTASGGVDPTFDGDGFATVSSSDVPGGSVFRAASIHAHDGGWIVGGDVTFTEGRDLVLVRINADGKRDTTFGDKGVVRIDVDGKLDKMAEVIVDGSNRIYVSGTRQSAVVDGFLLRLDARGTRDPLFGTNGFVTLPPGGGTAEGCAFSADGVINVVGATAVPGSRGYIARIRP